MLKLRLVDICLKPLGFCVLGFPESAIPNLCDDARVLHSLLRHGDPLRPDVSSCERPAEA